jgi:hypothetical protein
MVYKKAILSGLVIGIVCSSYINKDNTIKPPINDLFKECITLIVGVPLGIE